jgi:Mlc titration factor MtfA (ptsG expression regulator)
MSILKRHHRTKITSQPFPDEWESILDAGWGLWPRFNDLERASLRETVQILLDEKYWEGCAGVEVDDRTKVLIAAMAGTLLLDRPLDYFPNVHTILVYPAAYVQSQERVGSDGLVHTGSSNLGEAWYNGPVVLSWKDAEESALHPGRANNVVQHEFAHTLDMQTGMTNGTPPMRSKDEYARWHQVMTTQFAEVLACHERGGRDVIRAYGVTNVAEFFAVTTETFYDAPVALKAHRPALYDAFQEFYGVDPLQWFDGHG